MQVTGDSADNLIGGNTSSTGNLIAFNIGPGVSVLGDAVGTRITSNVIDSNGGPGIDLNGDGITPNGAAPCQGPNNLQNYPVIVDTSAGLEGWLAGSLPGTTYEIDVYADAAYDTDGSAQAQEELGSLSVTTNSSGQAMFAIPFVAPSNLPVITATATDPKGNTSELSPQTSSLNLDTPATAFLVSLGTPFVFSTEDGTAIKVVNPAAGPFDALAEISLSVAFGKLTLASTSGLSGTGNGTATLLYRGTIGTINADLEGLTYTAQKGFAGEDALAVTVQSYGATPLEAQLILSHGTFVVTTTADSGPGSLREAIEVPTLISGPPP